MTPYVARESIIVEMSKVVRDFVDDRDAAERLLAKYSPEDVLKYGPEAVRRELVRRRLSLIRAA